MQHGQLDREEIDQLNNFSSSWFLNQPTNFAKWNELIEKFMPPVKIDSNVT
jgi:hypothetical protein